MLLWTLDVLCILHVFYMQVCAHVLCFAWLQYKCSQQDNRQQSLSWKSQMKLVAYLTCIIEVVIVHHSFEESQKNKQKQKRHCIVFASMSRFKPSLLLVSVLARGASKALTQKHVSHSTAIMPWVTLLISLHCIWLAEYERLTMFHLLAQPQNPQLLLFESNTGRSKCLTPLQAFSVSLYLPLSLSLSVTVTCRGNCRLCSATLVLFTWSSGRIKKNTFL